MRDEKSVDIVIPCYNEEMNLRITLPELMAGFETFSNKSNIVLVDNGSTDESVLIGRNCGVNVHVQEGMTIGALRNYGVSVANGRYIVFLDADVLITRKWLDNFLYFIENNQIEKIITGAPCSIGGNSSVIEKCWFSGSGFSQKYINSGNLITTRRLFEEIGGFASDLRTGEDYDFCRRARSAGAEICINQNFHTIHLGYPRSLASFFKREAWHGEGDFQSLNTVVSSKPAMLSIANVMFLVLGLCLIPFHIYSVFILYLVFLFFITLFIAIKRSISMKCIPTNVALSTLYLFGRFASFLRVIRK